MYRYLDRPMSALGTPERLLVWAMRHWVQSLGLGRCACGTLSTAFRGHGVAEALDDFYLAMKELNDNAQALVRFAPPCCGHVNDDEAKLLALFDAGARGSSRTTRRMAEQLVQADAALNLAVTIERAAAIIMNAPEQATT